MKLNLKAQQKIQSKDRILNVASRLFKKNGFAATGIDQIMNEAGLTAGGFYSHFKSKSDLFENCLEHSLKSSRQMMMKGTEKLSGEDLNREIMKKYVSFLHRDFIEKGCVLPSVAAEIHRGSKKNNKLISKYISSWVNILTENMSPATSEKLRYQKALALVSQAVGAILLSRMTRGHDISDALITTFVDN